MFDSISIAEVAGGITAVAGAVVAITGALITTAERLVDLRLKICRDLRLKGGDHRSSELPSPESGSHRGGGRWQSPIKNQSDRRPLQVNRISEGKSIADTHARQADLRPDVADLPSASSPHERSDMRGESAQGAGSRFARGRPQEIGPLGHADETPLAPKPAVSARRGSVQFGRTK